MTTLVATFTEMAEAERAAARLRANGFGEVTVGTSDGGAGSVIGIGETVQGFRQRVLLVSTLGGAITGGALIGLMGLLYAGFPEIRNMATLEFIPAALGTALVWLITGLILGLVAGFLGGLALAGILGSAAQSAVDQGKGARRPQLVVTAPEGPRENQAVALIREGSVFELGRLPSTATR